MAGRGTAAHQPVVERVALLVLPHHHFQSAAKGYLRLVQSLQYLDGAERAQVAIEVPSIRNRVDVRPEEHRRQRGVRARPQRKDISGRVDARFQPQPFDQLEHIRAPRHIGIRVRIAADPVRERAALRPPEDAERFDSLTQTRRIHTRKTGLRERCGAKRA